MKVTGNIWPSWTTEPDPGSIKGQHEGMAKYIEKRGKLKISISKRELIELLFEADNELTEQLTEVIKDCDYEELMSEIEPSDFDIEVTNA